MQLPDCIFCKIVRGEIPSFKVSEDDKTLAILDINPVSRGHTLVLPKDHYVNILDAPEPALAATMNATKKVANALATYAEGVNVNHNANKAAGQVVDHLHFHIIPRYTQDGLQLWKGRGAYGKEEALEVLVAIRKLLKE